MTNHSSPRSAFAKAAADKSVSASAKAQANKPTRPTDETSIEILPPLADAEEWSCMPEDISLPPQLEFDPIERTAARNAVTPMKQRVFIRVLAETGRVSLAARAAGNVPGSFYYLRNQERGQSFGAAWDRARDFGTGRILDILLDHAINGVPEYIYKGGELVAERRRFNHSLMMWLVAHNMPEKFGVHGGLMSSNAGGPAGAARMKRLKAEWQREWAEAQRRSQPDIEQVKAEIMRKAKLIVGDRKLIEAALYLDDPEKRAAWEVLHGPQDWERIAQSDAGRRELLERETERAGDDEGTGDKANP